MLGTLDFTGIEHQSLQFFLLILEHCSHRKGLDRMTLKESLQTLLTGVLGA